MRLDDSTIVLLATVLMVGAVFVVGIVSSKGLPRAEMRCGEVVTGDVVAKCERGAVVQDGAMLRCVCEVPR